MVLPVRDRPCLSLDSQEPLLEPAGSETGSACEKWVTGSWNASAGTDATAVVSRVSARGSGTSSDGSMTVD